MVVTPLPIVTLVKPVQSKNAMSPMLVTPFPIVALIKPVQSEKALSPMAGDAIWNCDAGQPGA